MMFIKFLCFVRVPAIIREVSQHDVLVHFKGWNKRFDQWIPVGERLRLGKKTFKVTILVFRKKYRGIVQDSLNLAVFEFIQMKNTALKLNFRSVLYPKALKLWILPFALHNFLQKLDLPDILSFTF